MTKLIVFATAFAFYSNALLAQIKLASSPMPGYSAMREVTVWAGTTGKSSVYMTYTPINGEHQERRTQEVMSLHENGYTVHLVADSVEPGLKYSYTIYVNGVKQEENHLQQFESQPLWQHRTDPPEVNIAIGSCSYINEEKYDRPGKGYGRDYSIFNAIDKENPQAMIWLGDNIYLREVDYDSRTGVYLRNAHTRQTEELQPLLSNTHHFAIWDDHDYGPNNADRSYSGKHWTRDAFMDYWANPTYGFDGEGITSQFQWYDAHFFLLDNRWWRTSNERVTGERYQLGEQQIEWLIDALKFSRAPFKFVCVGGQVLNTLNKYENLATCAEERAYLLQRIIDEEIDNVIFLTGDRHHSELSKLEEKGITIWDLTVSPLTSKSYDALNEGNSLRVEGSHFAESNYGMLNITGTRKERMLNITLKDKEGKKLYDYQIPSVSK